MYGILVSVPIILRDIDKRRVNLVLLDYHHAVSTLLPFLQDF